MNKRYFSFLIFVLFLLLQTASFADDSDEVTYTNWHFNETQLGAVAAVQQGGLHMGAMGRYLPEYQFDRRAEDHFWTVGGDLGLTIFSRTDAPAFVAGEYGFFGAYHWDWNWDFRMAAGAQTWSDHNETGAFVGPDIIYHFKYYPKYFSVDGVFLTYKTVFHARIVNYISTGIEFKF